MTGTLGATIIIVSSIVVLSCQAPGEPERVAWCYRGLEDVVVLEPAILSGPGPDALVVKGPEITGTQVIKVLSLPKDASEDYYKAIESLFGPIWKCPPNFEP